MHTPLSIKEMGHPSFSNALLWRHNGSDGVSNRQPHDCLLNRSFRRRSKKTSKLRVTGHCVGNSPLTGEFPAQMASNAENVSIWWRHHGRSHIPSPAIIYWFAIDTALSICWNHYSDVTMGAMASQITSLEIVYSTVCSCADQRKHQSSVSLAFVRWIHRWPVNSPQKGPVARKMFPFDDIIMWKSSQISNSYISWMLFTMSPNCGKTVRNST